MLRLKAVLAEMCVYDDWVVQHTWIPSLMQLRFLVSMTVKNDKFPDEKLYYFAQIIDWCTF